MIPPAPSDNLRARVAIEPSTGTGITGTFSGISDNFQLHVLLMDTFPRHWWHGRRVSRSAAAIARGEGPQQGGEIVTASWNLHTLHALRPDATLPPPTDDIDDAFAGLVVSDRK